jgi:hypothetical protein
MVNAHEACSSYRNKQNISQLNRERISERNGTSPLVKPNHVTALYPINRWSNGLHASFEMDLSKLNPNNSHVNSTIANQLALCYDVQPVA